MKENLLHFKWVTTARYFGCHYLPVIDKPAEISIWIYERPSRAINSYYMSVIWDVTHKAEDNWSHPINVLLYIALNGQWWERKYVSLMCISEILKVMGIWNFVCLKYIYSNFLWNLNLNSKIQGQVGDQSLRGMSILTQMKLSIFRWLAWSLVLFSWG